MTLLEAVSLAHWAAAHEKEEASYFVLKGAYMDTETMEKIGRLTRRAFADDELYTFPVKLCDNEIDRDGERFSQEALEKMAELFIGKTVIIDHNPSAANQTARVYDTELVTDTEHLTSFGTPYSYLKGYAYMVRTAENADTITLIDGGILKEVSVSCSAASKTCSVCGKELHGGSCGHIKGKIYDGQPCHHILGGITDAYELSFVAVPAQAGAGVTKQYTRTRGGITMETDSFTPITTQAQLEAAAAPLIEAARAEVSKQYEGWISPEAHQQALDALDAENKSRLLAAYRSKAALSAGLAPELADRLTGNTEEEICKDAQLLASITRKGCTTPPFRTAESSEFSDVEKAFYEKNEKLIPNTRKEQ